MTNKLSQFWQELKRRKVLRVITVYAGAAFVILELVDIVSPSLRLPEWTMNFMIVLLCAGFIIAVILSWIYDIHPEGGIVKTETADKVKAEDIPKSSSSWKIASYVSFVVIVGLIVLNVIPRNNRDKVSEVLDKSIAVLPFRNDSPDEEKMYFINGTMEAILDNLCRIEDLRVPGRTSVEQYRDVAKPIPVIAQELKVSYILEGSGQKIGDRVLLTVQLLDGINDHHLWSKQYDREIQEVEDLIDIQSEIAQLVAAEIKAVITPSEKELIEKIPTTSISALDLFQRGNEAYWRYWSDGSDTVALERAEYFFNEALKYDSTLAQAYTGLARIYWGSEGYFSENRLDTARVLLDKALSFDPELAEAHTLYGAYYNERNDTLRAMRELDKAIALNPNDWEAYFYKANISPGFINFISNRQKAIMLNRGPELSRLLNSLGGSCLQIGFFEKAEEIFEEILKLTGDSLGNLYRRIMLAFWREDFNAEIELCKEFLAHDSTRMDLINEIFCAYLFLDETEQALKYGKIWVEYMKETGALGVQIIHRVGYYYWLVGLDEEADYYFNLQIENCEKEIELERARATERNLNTYYDLAATYAFTGETEKALENLRIWITRPTMNLGMLIWLRGDWLFDPIRDNPEFQQILNTAEAKYEAEHEQVRQWLEENEML